MTSATCFAQTRRTTTNTNDQGRAQVPQRRSHTRFQFPISIVNSLWCSEAAHINICGPTLSWFYPKRDPPSDAKPFRASRNSPAWVAALVGVGNPGRTLLFFVIFFMKKITNWVTSGSEKGWSRWDLEGKCVTVRFAHPDPRKCYAALSRAARPTVDKSRKVTNAIAGYARPLIRVLFNHSSSANILSYHVSIFLVFH